MACSWRYGSEGTNFVMFFVEPVAVMDGGISRGGVYSEFVSVG